LHVALAGAGLAPPYVLVGHSFGGQNMRLYASRHPADVAGLVLVDAQHPDLARRFAAILTPPEWAQFFAGYTANREGADLLASDAEMAAAAPLPAVPLVALVRGIAPRPEDFPPAWPIATLEVVWQELQGRLADSVPGGELWRAARSGHYIQRDEPDPVGINTYWALRNTHWALSILIGPGGVGEGSYLAYVEVRRSALVGLATYWR